MRVSMIVACAVASAACTPFEPTPSDLEGTLFIANKHEASLSQVDLTSGAETKRVDTCESPHELALSPDKSHVAVACYSGTNLQIFTSDTLEMVKSIELGEKALPHGVLWHVTDVIVATAEGRGTIFTVNAPLSEDPQVREIGRNEGVGPHMVVLNPDATVAWGAAIPNDTVTRYDLVEGVETHRVKLSGRTEGIGLSTDGTGLFVGTLEEAKVYRLDPATLAIQAEIPTGAVPIRVMAQPGGPHLVTSDLGDGSLSVIDEKTDQVVRTIPVSGDADAEQVTVIFSPDGSRLYVAETANDRVAEIDFESGQILRRLAGGRYGDGLAVTD